MQALYFVKIEPGSTNMLPGQGKKLVGSWLQDLTGIDATASLPESWQWPDCLIIIPKCCLTKSLTVRSVHVRC